MKRQEADKARIENENRFRDFAEVASDWFWETDANLCFSYVSPRIRELIGEDPESILGRKCTELGDPKTDPAKWARYLEELRARRPFRDFVFSREMSDGQVRFIRTSGKPLFDDAGNFQGYRGVGTDVSNQVLAERDRLEAEIQLARAIEAIPAAFALFDDQDRLIISNREYERTYATPLKPMVPGARFEDLVRAFAAHGGVGSTAEETEAWIARRLNRRKSPARGYQYYHSHSRWAEVNDFLLHDGHLITVVTDITERKRVEAVVRDREGRVKRLRSELLQASRMTAMAHLSSALAHELNQPLAAITNYVRAASRLMRTPPGPEPGKPDSGKIEELLDKSVAQARRASDVISGLRDIAERGDPARHGENLNRAVEEACELGIEGLTGAEVNLTYDLAGNLPPVWMNRVQIQQVILNLVRNALEAMSGRPRRKLTIKSFLAGENLVEVTVSDSGPGLPEAVQEQLFKPFNSTKVDGMGIGLSICHSIVEAHGGRIWAVQEKDKGTTFHFTLPVQSHQVNGDGDRASRVHSR